jgi:membrane-anchored protein YejM (alkaline phosphatase superfamily)
MLPLLAGCGAPRPPVIWIVVDTLRADHLEWYGYHRSTAPEWKALIDRGTLFEAASTPQPETSPAVASLLTGLYPPRHGVRALYQKLHGDNLTAAEILAEVGYDTAAFVSSFVMIDDFTNFAQGFSVYDDFVTERELSAYNFERRAADTLRLAREWVASRPRSDPYFLFVHLIDPHGPYDPPGAWADRFHSTETRPVPGKIAKYQRLPGVSDFATYRDRYDAEIAYLSSELGAFFTQLATSGELDRALVILTADHGESLGERERYFRHGDNVYQENLHIPLVILLPGSIKNPRAARRPEAVSLVDLLPTTLEVARVKPGQALDGRSLLPLLRGEGTISRPVFAWSRPAGQLGFAMIERTRKSMLKREPSSDQWLAFDLATDSSESQAVGVGGEARATMDATLEEWLGHRPAFEVETNVMDQALRADFVRKRLTRRDQDDLKRLKSLGYLN